MAQRTGGKRIRSSRAALLPLTLGFMLNSDLQAKKATAAVSNLAVICAKEGVGVAEEINWPNERVARSRFRCEKRRCAEEKEAPARISQARLLKFYSNWHPRAQKNNFTTRPLIISTLTHLIKGRVAFVRCRWQTYFIAQHNTHTQGPTWRRARTAQTN